MIVSEKGYLLGESYKRHYRFDKKTVIYQKQVKGKLNKEDSSTVLKKYHNCPTRNGKTKLWSKYLRLLKREKELFKDTDPVKLKILEAIYKKNKRNSFFQSWNCKHCKKKTKTKRKESSIGKRIKTRCNNCKEFSRIIVKGDSKT